MGLYPLTVNTPPEDPAHIYAEDDAAIYEAIVGGDGVYDIGNKMEATVIDNNTVRISNGVLSVGGHLARIKYGDYQDMVIDNGESGKNRNDLIVANFSTTGPRGVDTYTLNVIKGEAVSGEAADPAVAEGNLYEGATERDLPLYRVRLEGISIVAVDVLYSLKEPMGVLQSAVNKLNKEYIIVKKTYTKNVTAGQLYFTDTITIPAGYKVVSAWVRTSHASTLCGAPMITEDTGTISIPYVAGAIQNGEEFYCTLFCRKDL